MPVVRLVSWQRWYNVPTLAKKISIKISFCFTAAMTKNKSVCFILHQDCRLRCAVKLSLKMAFFRVKQTAVVFGEQPVPSTKHASHYVWLLSKPSLVFATICTDKLDITQA